MVLQNGVLLGSVDDLQAGATGFAVHRTDNTLWTWGWGSQGYATDYGVTGVVSIGWEGPLQLRGAALPHERATARITTPGLP